ncbi:MAG TPA: RNA polymerase sigma factor [Bacteroidales bacterium]|nr:RNA polymerase sigma factor [Bacteroidales bacterium]HPT21063.1 RNA polymerase sigma factor [Bacteroidales bacterium]
MDYKGDIFYIDQVLNGNINAFSYIADRHKDKAFNLAFRICCNREDAEEITQDSFLKAFRSLKSFKRECSFATWLYRIVYNSAISHIRIKKVKILSLEDFPVEANDFTGISSNEEEADKEYLNSLVNFALQKISEEERGLISLFHYEEMSIDEISEVTGISKSNIKVKLFRARRKMTEIIQKAERKKEIIYD